MQAIFKTVYKVFKDKYKNETQDFLEGFELCFTLFQIGIKQNPAQYNLHILLREAEKEQERLKDMLLQRDWLESSKERKDKIIIEQQKTRFHERFGLAAQKYQKLEKYLRDCLLKFEEEKFASYRHTSFHKYQRF